MPIFATAYDPTSDINTELGTLSTDLGLIVPIALGIALIFWVVRKGISVFKSSSK